MTTPTFDQVNLVVADIDATLAFYRALGVALPDDAGGVWPAGTGARHAAVTMPGGMRLEFDNVAMARLWYPGGRNRPVLTFSFPSRAAVDHRYAELIAAGHAGMLAPYDAFWGGRYAVVADPDGHECGLMSPTDPGTGYTPTG